MKKKTAIFMMAIVMVAGSDATVHASPERMSDGTLFDSDYYAETYPDLMQVFGRDTGKLYQHYKNYGKAEGRVALPPKYVYPELPEPALGDKYTADELIAAYRTIMEANGITWDMSLKGNWSETIGQHDVLEWYHYDDNYNGGSWGTGFIAPDKAGLNNVDWAAYTDLESFAFDDGTGHTTTSCYMEVLGWDDSMGMYEIVAW
ncbi:hypothetical protein IMSAGC011_03022 [Lachnospiraceae bacterium]|nr:hypothetical protein IMSAGC011_03022 [Lachnospiraceae bacterium]